jgi:hypothetical protein
VAQLAIIDVVGCTATHSARSKDFIAAEGIQNDCILHRAPETELSGMCKEKLSWLFSLALVHGCCTGCRHQVQTGFSEPQGATPARPRDPQVTVHGKNSGPIQYDWAFTNSPDGTRVLKFVPGPGN